MPRAEPNAHLGRDLLVTPFFQADSWGTLDLTPDPPGAAQPGERIDLGVASGGDNLRQALILRLLTPQGSLADLGHSGYGSRLHELIGHPYSEQLRLLCRSMVLQALQQERRVDRILQLDVAPPAAATPDTLRISLTVLPVGDGDPVSLGIEVSL